ncbi:winged helix-turn-helix domain-containing protein [Streptomyces sp. NPDC033538]|uniref:helix-turn-helix domain-containing protein n=1 Tax=Streptomyces sp. NPDC033538 TaxID=3155367 RepID=UPI0033C78D98
MALRPCDGVGRVGAVVARATGVVLSRASVWRLLTGRLGWSLQRPERRAVERDESEIARWIVHEWPRIRELANLAGDHLADVVDATEQGIQRTNHNPQLPWSFLAHTGLAIHPPHPPNLRKDQ